MSQVSYGTITITDTNDIEQIYMVYAGSESNITPPDVDNFTLWKTDITQTSGTYIWQRAVVKKSGIEITAANFQQFYGEPVCITGEGGRSIKSIISYYCNYGTGTPDESYSGWKIDTPEYDEDKPNYWVKTVIIYVDNSETGFESSGSIVTIEDGEHKQVTSLKVALEPIQDLNGYDYPWVGGAGKNKLDTSNMSTNGQSGVTFSRASDGTITVGGKATAAVYKTIGSFKTENGVSYTITGTPSGGANGKYRMTVVGYGYDYGSGYTFTGDGNSHDISIDIYTGYPSSGTLTFKPMIRFASETDATYEPYTNICPISGRTEVKTIVSPTTSETDGQTYTTALGRTVYGGTLDVVSGVLTVDRAMVDLGSLSWSYQSTWTSWYTDYRADVKGTTVGTAKPNLVAEQYGVLTTNDAITPNTGYGISTTVRGSSGSRIIARNGSSTTKPQGKLVYELATPQTYQLTPQQIELLVGENHLWSDGRDVEVSGFTIVDRDIQIHLDNGITNAMAKAADAQSRAATAETNAASALSLSQATQQHFWFNSVKTGNIEAGAYITDVVIDNFKPNKSGNYLLAGSNGIELGNGSHPYMQLTASKLNFFHPNSSNIDAQLSSNGLIVKSGGIEAGTVGQNGGIYLSTENYGTTHNNQAITINGHEAKNWRQIIGTKFGVDSDGVLYAGGANIQGKITVTSGSNVYTTDEVNPLDVGGRNLIISFTTTIGSILDSSGELIDNPRGVVSDLIEVQPNEKYVLQYWLPNNLTDTGTDRAWNCKICWYDQEETISEETTGETYISGYVAEYFSDYKVYFDVAPTNAKYCRVCFELPASYQNGEVSQEWINGDDGYRWKLEQGTIATDWTLAPEDTNNIAEQQDLYLITDNETTTEGALYHYLNDNDELVSQAAEWSPTYQSPNQYNPYIWWKYILTYSSGQSYESTPVIFNSIPQGQIDILTQQIGNQNLEIDKIDNATTSLDGKYNTLNQQYDTIYKQLDRYEKNITIDSKVPLIKVYTKTSTEESSVTVYSSNVIIKGGGNTTTEINSEGLKTNTIETQTLMPKNNNIGHLAFIARQNGHLSLKVVT